MKYVAAGMNPMDLKRGIDTAVDRRSSTNSKKRISKPCDHRRRSPRSARSRPTATREIGEMIAEAMDKVGKEGVITVEDGQGLETELDVVEGMQFDRGYLSPYFITNADKHDASSSTTPTSCCTRRRSATSAAAAAGARSRSCKAGKPLLIIAEDVEGEALATLVVNKHPRRPQGRGRQGAGLRRPPQGDARGHRDPHRRHR
jgi:chaperonin GroEL